MKFLPRIHSQHISTQTKSHPLTGPSLETFRLTAKLSNPTPWISPLTPLWSNPEFLSSEWPYRDVLATHFFRSGTLLLLEDLNIKLAPQHIPSWTYMQIKHFLTRRENAYLWKKPLTALETLCIKKTRQRHHISGIYSCLFWRIFSLDKCII